MSDFSHPLLLTNLSFSRNAQFPKGESTIMDDLRPCFKMYTFQGECLWLWRRHRGKFSLRKCVFFKKDVLFLNCHHVSKWESTFSTITCNTIQLILCLKFGGEWMSEWESECALHSVCESGRSVSEWVSEWVCPPPMPCESGRSVRVAVWEWGVSECVRVGGQWMRE